MQTFHAILAMGMLITGSLNTIFTTWCDKQSAIGLSAPPNLWAKLAAGSDTANLDLDHPFNHPFFQALGMFVGEFFCMIAYLATRKAAARNPDIPVTGVQGRTKGALWFALPAMLDITGTGTMYAGLCLSSASVFQMLRAASVVFTCALSATVLKNKIHGFQWFSVLLIVIGVTVVGYVSVSGGGGGDGHKKDTASVLVGDILILLAQFATACQMCLEEKLMNKFPSPALKVVGLEGMFGFPILSIALFAMYYIRVDDCSNPTHPDVATMSGGCPLENVPDALVQLGNNWKIGAAICGNAFSIAFFNFFGISVTQQLSAAHRMVLDSVRTLVVWGVSLMLGWEQFMPLQLVGFVVLSIGTAMYNEIIRVPQLFAYPEREAPQEDALVESRGRIESEMSAQASKSFIEAVLKEESTALSTSFIRN